jgi:protein-S-isoprenylcysteine O-methyltransferase Ste14
VANQEVGMTLVPDFDPGLWNVWIILVVHLAALSPMWVGAGARTAEARMDGEPPLRDLTTRSRVAAIVTHALMPLAILYGVFVPLERGTWWLYAGLIVSAAGILMALAVALDFARAPLGEPMSRGVYAVSRNPMYLSSFLVYAGAGLAGSSWVLLLCALIWIVGIAMVVPEEEQILLAKYGPSYEWYMRRTPRWIGLPQRSHPIGAA